MPVFAGPPAREPLIDEAIELSQRPPADPTEVVPSAPDIRIELDDHLVETQPRLSRLPSQFITSASQRLWRDVEIQPLKPPLMRVAQKGERFASHVQHTRLVRMQRQSKPRHQLLKPGERSIWTMRREQDEIIRIADQSSGQLTALHAETKAPVEQVQVDIGQQRGNHSPLWRALPSAV
jgi:hypothetical protein